MALQSIWVRWLRLWRLGRYCRMRPLVFSQVRPNEVRRVERLAGSCLLMVYRAS